MPITDLFRKGAPAFSTTLAADKAFAAGTMTLQTAAGIPTTTAVDFTVGRVDVNGNKTPALKAVYTGLLSGTTVSSLTLKEGTDQLHPAGTPVEVTFTAATWNDAVTGITAQHKQLDGSHVGITNTGGLNTDTLTTTGTATLNQVSITGNNGIAAKNLATNAIELGKTVITTSPTGTSSTTAVAVATLTVTVTIPAGGRDVEIEFYAGRVNTSTGPKYAIVTLWDGTVGSGTQLAQSELLVSSAGGAGTFMICKAIDTPGAGSKTYNVGLAADPGGSSSSQIIASATQRAYISVKAI